MPALGLTAADVAAVLQISTPTAYELMRRTDFPSFKVSESARGNIRVTPEDLAAWVENRKKQHMRTVNG